MQQNGREESQLTVSHKRLARPDTLLAQQRDQS